MQNPDHLRVAGAALDLADQMFDYTEGFPRTQRYVMVAQMQRAALSIGSNIHEACGRHAGKSFVAFIHYALGSASELEFQLRLARRRNYGDPQLASRLTSPTPATLESRA